jgi:hypothetical protein
VGTFSVSQWKWKWSGTRSYGRQVMKPWLVQASCVLMAIAPMVARLVSITLRAGNRRAELSAKPTSVMWSLESSMNIVPAPVRLLGENHWIVPPSQYFSSFRDGVPPPEISNE